RIGVEQCRIESRQRDALRREQQTDLRATKNDAVGTGRLTACHDVNVMLPGLIADDTLAELLEDYIVDGRAVRRIRHDRIDAMTLAQPRQVEILLHRVTRRQQ